MPGRPHKEHHVHHPAHLPYVLTIILIALVVVFGFITVFIPWAQKDIAVGVRAWAFPFKTCLEQTFSEVNEETCIDNDFIEPEGGVPLTGESEKCKAYILATIAFVFLSVLPGVILLLLLGYILEHLWWHPIVPAMIANGVIIFVCISCFLAWIFFIVYMEATCAPGSIFPVSPGYSYGFIMYLFNTVFSILAIVTGVWGTRRIIIYKEMQSFIDELKHEEHEVVEMQYPMAPPMTASPGGYWVPPGYRPLPPTPVMQSTPGTPAPVYFQGYPGY